MGRFLGHPVDNFADAHFIKHVGKFEHFNLRRKCYSKTLSKSLIQSAENRRRSVTDSGYAYVTQWFWFRKFERQPQRK